MALGNTMSTSVRRLLVAVALVVAGLAVVGVSPASAAVPANGTRISCSGSASAPTAPFYVMAGGAPLWVKTPANLGLTSTDFTYHSDCATLFPSPTVPSNGTVIRAYKGGTAGAFYVIVGGAPFAVSSAAAIDKSSWSPVAVDVNVIPSTTATTDVTKDGSTTLHGYLHARPATGTKFRGYNASTKAMTYYALDSLRHPVPQSATNTGPIAPQATINGCARMDCDPNGGIVNAGGAGYGVLHVDGWAMDYPSSAPVSVRLTAGTSTWTLPANQATSEVLASTAGNHGFSANLPIAAGTYALCGTVLGTAPGGTTLDLGCSTVTVPGAKPGRVKKPKAKAKGHRKVQVKWKTPVQNGSPITEYVVKMGKKKKQVPGSKHKLVFKHLHAGRTYSVKVQAINSVGLGKYSKPSKKVTAK